MVVASVVARGEAPTDWWCAHPENQCYCPSRPAIERCRCAHCLSWLRRAPRCSRTDCHEYARWGDRGLCWLHDSEQRARRSETSRRAAAKRRPPRPAHEHEAGCCSLCGSAACWGCGRTHDADGHPVRLEVEHVRPLWSLTDQERTELRWWLPYNLQLLCESCHKAKSAREASERAMLRRQTASA